MKSRLVRGVETRKSSVQPSKAFGSEVSKLKARIWTPRDLWVSQMEESVGDEVQITRLVGGMRLCERMAERVAAPSLPVQLVRASMLFQGNFQTSEPRVSE